MDSRCILQVEGLWKGVGDRELMRDVNFGIAEGQHVAIVARNGTGKSTLMNILIGRSDYEQGRITWRNDLRIHYLAQDGAYMLQDVEGKRVEDDCTGAEWQTMSGGQRKRKALEIVLAGEPDVLILDEPTNHLDLEYVVKLEETLRKTRTTILMVTHDRYFLDRICTEILELDNHSIYSYHGNYAYYLEKRAERIDAWNAETEKLRNLYRYELDWMRRMPQARGHKSKGRIDNFYKLDERVHENRQEMQMQLQNCGVYIGSKIWEAKDISFSFRDKPEEKKILEKFSYVFSRYEKTGIIGNNGTGKTTFLRLLLGEVQPESGVIEIGETVRFGYYSQKGLSVPAGKKVLEVVSDETEYIDMGDKRLTASQFLQHFLFSPSQQHDYVEKLSGGERQRLNLCRVLMKNPNFLILDEPTNDLDIQTMTVLEDYLRHFSGCVMVVSHDRYFMDKVVDHLFVFRGEGKVEDFPGNYTQWREKEALRADECPKDYKKNENKNENEAPKKQKTEQVRKLSFKEQQEYKALEGEIEKLETEKQELEAQLSGGLSAIEEIQKASTRYEQVKAMLDEKEMRWLELSEFV